MRDGKVLFFFGRDGRPKHACFDSPHPGLKIYGTLCGKMMPGWWRPIAANWQYPEQCGLDCPQCCRSVARLLEKRREEWDEAEAPTSEQ